MTIFGLKEAEVAELVRAVAGESLDRTQIEHRFARAAWTGIAEPGDRLAGGLVRVLGADRSLTAIIEHWTVEQVAEALASQGSPDEFGAEELTLALDRWRPRLVSASVMRALAQAARFGARLRVPDDDAWPQGLGALHDHAPLALWTRGGDDAFRALDRSIALVGARASTGYGEHVTTEAAAGLVDRGYAITSGGAYGIDGIAHRAALVSDGVTIAFMAGGIDRFYPAGHESLLTRIVESGCVISELPCGMAPTKWRFLQRNRLIAAASLATVVIEAGWRSGTLNTAAHAAELGRPLGAVPGPVTSAASAGCHRLLRQGAACVTNAEQMAELAPLGHGVPESRHIARRSPEHTRVLDALALRTGRSVEDVAARAGVSIDSARSALGVLTLEGDVRESERGFTRVSSASRRDEQRGIEQPGQ